jgi:deazaflavin-dependent oxidoreductase (nitroreductase family)
VDGITTKPSAARRTAGGRRLARLATMAAADDELSGQEHVRVYRESAGERGYDWRGTTILLLTTTGRTSGEPRTTPLIHRTDGDRWVVVASRVGRRTTPRGTRTSEPICTRRSRSRAKRYRSSRVPLGRGAHPCVVVAGGSVPAYDDYQRKTDREIPIVVLMRRLHCVAASGFDRASRCEPRQTDRPHGERPARPQIPRVAAGVQGI